MDLKSESVLKICRKKGCLPGQPIQNNMAKTFAEIAFLLFIIKVQCPGGEGHAWGQSRPAVLWLIMERWREGRQHLLNHALQKLFLIGGLIWHVHRNTLYCLRKKNFYSQRMLNVDGKASASERHYMSGGTLRLSWDTVGWQGLGHNWDTGHCNKLTTEISHEFSEEFHNIISGPQWGNNNCKRN